MPYKNILLKISLLGVFFSVFSTNLSTMNPKKRHRKKRLKMWKKRKQQESKQKISHVLGKLEKKQDKIINKMLGSFRLITLLQEEARCDWIYKNKKTHKQLESEMKKLDIKISVQEWSTSSFYLDKLNKEEQKEILTKLKKIKDIQKDTSKNLAFLQKEEYRSENEIHDGILNMRSTYKKKGKKNLTKIKSCWHHERTTPIVITDENTCSYCNTENKDLKNEDLPLKDVDNIENNNPVDLDLSDENEEDNENNNNTYFCPAVNITLGVSCVIIAALLTARLFKASQQ